ncbi:hypothetical protein MH117_17155 [Paenibacillus sp. ACRRX]|nr:hypothetical protein [Paenibacillus sp. ACRRX]MCG7409147.1 hypothetical protein [Paenibacillus sp. ACRRX]MDK8181859.1 hypothetical protein [Paenibacillus sp. UMB4589-SE434]
MKPFGFKLMALVNFLGVWSKAQTWKFDSITLEAWMLKNKIKMGKSYYSSLQEDVVLLSLPQDWGK